MISSDNDNYALKVWQLSLLRVGDNGNSSTSPIPSKYKASIADTFYVKSQVHWIILWICFLFVDDDKTQNKDFWLKKRFELPNYINIKQYNDMKK